METILTGLVGLLLGGIIVGLYYSSKLKNSQHQVLDKQTIIKLIKEHMTKSDKPKPRRNYRRKPTTRKKYEKAS